ncbi:hypothetical protein I5Q42_06125 [Serratia marcescens]|nr:hypothetical protein [Serratia marcescens]MBH2910574.1 hypothetical protein [Serratia marcescens]HCU0428868.1 hypothetical protein [Serratia marcescens]
MAKCKSNPTEKNDQGWGFPYLAKKAHYFANGSATSLCGKWLFTGIRIDEHHDHPDNCSACMRKRAKVQEKNCE